jgi:hypothetical protein
LLDSLVENKSTKYKRVLTFDSSNELSIKNVTRELWNVRPDGGQDACIFATCSCRPSQHVSSVCGQTRPQLIVSMVQSKDALLEVAGFNFSPRSRCAGRDAYVTEPPPEIPYVNIGLDNNVDRDALTIRSYSQPKHRISRIARRLQPKTILNVLF